MLIDLNSAPLNTTQYDVCIVGAGPAGITVARTLAASGKRVALFEGGALEYTEASQKLYEGKSTGLNDWDAVKNCRLRYFGGTSNHWSGLCSYFDEIDFKNQPNGMSGWPIAREAIFQYFDAAKEILDLAKDAFPAKTWPGQNFKPFIASLSPPTRFNSKYKDELAKSKNIDLYINANLVDIVLHEGLTTVKALELANGKRVKYKISAKQYVLAMGTIENARMLLASNKQIKTGIGNQGDMVGRCYMEHFNISFGRFAIDKKDFWQSGDIGLQPTAGLITKHRIGNGVMSFNPSAKPVSYGRTKVLKQALRNLICKSENATDLSRKLVDFDCEGDGIITSMIEQSPNLDSRVTLDKAKDVFGLPKVILNWQYNTFDAHTIRTLGMESAKELARLGAARVQLADFILDEKMPITVGHHCHQMGTTRMSSSPKNGVVDENLKVHGIENLFISGSSVFPTGGGCNPTFTVTMLALRLGHYISTKI